MRKSQAICLVGKAKTKSSFHHGDSDRLADRGMNTAQSAYVTGLRWERHTLSISSEVITDANPSRSGVLWHLFLFSGLASASVPSRTCKSRQKTRDGRTGRPAQLSALSPVSLLFLSTSFLLITALPFVLPSVIFIAPSLSMSFSLRVRWGHYTPTSAWYFSICLFLPMVFSEEFDVSEWTGSKIFLFPIQMPASCKGKRRR